MQTQPQQAAGAVSAVALPRPLKRIQPSKGLVRLDLRELWRFRELLYFLVWRDVKARYKQTYLGALWAIFRPVISMILFSVIFGRLAGIPSGSDAPYPLFVFSGLLVWMYFSSAFNQGSGSVIGNASIVTKAYFPRVYVTLGAVASPLVDLALSLVVLFGLFAWYQRLPGWQLALLPAFALLALAVALGIGMWLSAVTVRYRDVPFALPFIVQLWMYATPVIYPVTFIPADWRWLITLNPLTGVVEGFRWSLLGGGAPRAADLASSVGVAAALLVVGLVYFRRAERTFADLI